jgi:RNA polymerase sigma-70 factor (ECF subfamily)
MSGSHANITYLSPPSGNSPENTGAMINTEAMSASFLNMLEGHRALLYQIIRTYCPDTAGWKDLEQEIILQLWRSFPNFDDTYKLSTWVYRIAFNVTVTEFRRSKKRPETPGNMPTDHFFNRLPSEAPDPAQEERKEALYAAIRALSEADRPVLLLHLDGHNYQDISDIIGISTSNVGTKLNRIRQRLKTIIERKNTHL